MIESTYRRGWKERNKFRRDRCLFAKAKRSEVGNFVWEVDLSACPHLAEFPDRLLVRELGAVRLLVWLDSIWTELLPE